MEPKKLTERKCGRPDQNLEKGKHSKELITTDNAEGAEVRIYELKRLK